MAVIVRTTIHLCFIEILLEKVPFRTQKQKVAAPVVVVKCIENSGENSG
jgi:hypothetical protein